MKVEDGTWSIVDKRINMIFAKHNHLPFFADLYETKEDGEETAEFVIASKEKLFKVIIRFDGVSPSHRTTCVCRGDILDVTLTDHMTVTCDDQTARVVWRSDSLQSFDADLTNSLTSSLSKSYVTDNGQFAVIVIAEDSGSHVSFQFAHREHPILEKCVDVSATFYDGLLIEHRNSGVQFLAIIDGNLTVMNESCDGLHTVVADVCNSGDCYFHHTEHLLYISDHNRTIVINPRTYEIVMIQYADICDVLPSVERALQQCIVVPITSTNTYTLVMQPATASTDLVASTKAVTVNPPSSLVIQATTRSSTTMQSTTINYVTSTTTITDTNTATVFVPTITYSPSSIKYNPEPTDISQTMLHPNTTTANIKETQAYIIMSVIAVAFVALVFLMVVIVAVCHHCRKQLRLHTSTKEVLEDFKITDLSESPHLYRRSAQASSGHVQRGDQIVVQPANPILPPQYNPLLHTVQLKERVQREWQAGRMEPSACTKLIIAHE